MITQTASATPIPSPTVKARQKPVGEAFANVVPLWDMPQGAKLFTPLPDGFIVFTSAEFSRWNFSNLSSPAWTAKIPFESDTSFSSAIVGDYVLLFASESSKTTLQLFNLSDGSPKGATQTIPESVRFGVQQTAMNSNFPDGFVLLGNQFNLDNVYAVTPDGVVQKLEEPNHMKGADDPQRSFMATSLLRDGKVITIEGTDELNKLMGLPTGFKGSFADLDTHTGWYRRIKQVTPSRIVSTVTNVNEQDSYIQVFDQYLKPVGSTSHCPAVPMGTGVSDVTSATVSVGAKALAMAHAVVTDVSAGKITCLSQMKPQAYPIAVADDGSTLAVSAGKRGVLSADGKTWSHLLPEQKNQILLSGLWPDGKISNSAGVQQLP